MRITNQARRVVAGVSFALVSLAHVAGAQTAAAPGAAGAGAPVGPAAYIAQFAPFLLVIEILYFLMIRPQQQKQKEMTTMQSGLKKGDRVLTQAGIYGTIVGVDNEKAVLRVDDNVKLEFQRSTIIGVVGDKA